MRSGLGYMLKTKGPRLAVTVRAQSLRSHEAPGADVPTPQV